MEKARSIRGLDGLRAISIGMVIMGHASEASELPDSIAWPRVWSAALGVTIFFGISGFLITTLLLDEEQRDGRFSLKGFYFRRAFRILPAALTFLACLAVASALWPEPLVTVREMAAATFFCRNFVDGGALSGHFWTLSVEEQFYAFWPAVLLFLPRRVVLPAILAWVFVSPFWVHANLVIFGSTHVNSWRTDFRLDPIFVGAALALARREPWFRSVNSWASVHGRPVFWAGVAGVALVLADIGSKVHGLGFVLAYAMDLAVLLLLVGAIGGPGVVAATILENPAVRFVGRLSYSLYLWQQPFLKPYAWPGGPPWFVHFPGCLASAFALSCGSYFLIEKPFLALRGRLQVATPKVDLQTQSPQLP
jgi:peptidoglycan/LPS O-acetylase OafA/YrhL